MNYITYENSLDILKNVSKEEKIQFFVLRIKSCPFCDDCFKNNGKELLNFIQNDFDLYVINCDNENIPFPPPSSPTLYFYHKNFKQPFIRQGMLPVFEMTKELEKFIKIKNGESYESVFK